MTLLIVNFLWQ